MGLDRRPAPLVDVTCDLAESDLRRALGPLIEEVDVVFHLAACPGVRQREAGVKRFRDNVVATQRLLEALPVRIPVVAASSSSVYGGVARHRGRFRPSREEDPLRPRGGYAASKVAMEELCEWRRGRGGLVTVLRPFTVVGGRQRTDMALAIWAEALSQGRPLRIFGSPERVRDLTDVRDVVRAFIRAAEVGHQGVINVGTGVGHRLSVMAAAMVEASGRTAEFTVEEALPEEAEATLADTSSCRRLLGFVPATDLEEVARRVWQTKVALGRPAGVAAR